MKNKILDVLKTKYSITKDLENRVEQLLECATDDNQFNNLDEILEWFFSKKIKYKSAVNTIDLKDVSDN
jgi:hypothetical protein